MSLLDKAPTAAQPTGRSLEQISADFDSPLNDYELDDLMIEALCLCAHILPLPQREKVERIIAEYRRRKS